MLKIYELSDLQVHMCSRNTPGHSSASVVLTTQDKWVIVFHGEWFQLAEPFDCWEMTEDTNMISGFLKEFSTTKIEAV